MILFVDDEKRYVHTYLLELKLSGYDVSFQHDIDEALRVYGEHVDRIDLVILDLMMPPGFSFHNVDTETGLRTGLRFYEKIRQKAPQLPVIILTNVSDDEVARFFSEDNHCKFLGKHDCLPFELVEVVKRGFELPFGRPRTLCDH